MTTSEAKVVFLVVAVYFGRWRAHLQPLPGRVWLLGVLVKFRKELSVAFLQAEGLIEIGEQQGNSVDGCQVVSYCLDWRR